MELQDVACGESLKIRAKQKQLSISNGLSPELNLTENLPEQILSKFLWGVNLPKISQKAIAKPKTVNSVFPLSSCNSSTRYHLDSRRKWTWFLQPVLLILNGSEFMQHKILPSYVLKTKRNNITALGIFYEILSNEWVNFSNYYIYYIRKRRISHKRIMNFYQWFHTLTLSRNEKVSWDEKETRAELRSELPSWDSLSVEMLDTE